MAPGTLPVEYVSEDFFGDDEEFLPEWILNTLVDNNRLQSIHIYKTKEGWRGTACLEREKK